ncbi:MAG: hypothetical protein JXN64_13285 [Spirochaetes bacterium]|nr:hypothetical protein [Spirochaetota bacterium]
MTADDIKDLKVWKANLEYILADKKRKLECINNIIRYEKERPDVVCIMQNIKEQKPDIERTVFYIKNSIIKINKILEEHYGQSGSYYNKANAKQAGRFGKEYERSKLIQIQTKLALLAN